MTVLLVLGSLLLVLVVACFWEARTGRPEWGASTRRREDGAGGAAAAARSAKVGIASTVTFAALDGGDG